MIEFGNRLRQFRKERNMTQKQLADLIRVKNSVISFYEVGERTPSLEVIVKLASVLHVSADALLGIEKDETVNISGLSDTDKQLVQALVARLSQGK